MLTRRYGPLRSLFLAPAEGFGLRPRLFLPFGQKRAVLAIFEKIYCPVVTLVTFISKVSNFERNP